MRRVEKMERAVTEKHPAEQTEETFPKNVVVLATHGSYYVPDRVRGKLSKGMETGIEEGGERKQYLLRLLRNFSDSLTRKILQGIPDDQKVVAGFSRAIGDPARAEDAEGLFRQFDFGAELGGNPVWAESLTEEEKKWLIENFHQRYHERVVGAIEKAEQEHDRVIVFDIHDTGVRMMGVAQNGDYYRKDGFPDINLGNLGEAGDVNGKSCAPEIMEDFIEALKKHWQKAFNYEPRLGINEPYKGKGYVTNHYGAEYNDSLPQERKFHRNVIQVELGRFLYMDERTQKPDRERLQKVREIVQAAMAEVGHKYENKK